ncbi:MAG: SulP family inorganic anion transporter [Phenylobacterium sp.]|nr:SulP family inorganic anion transporter [Phenylobacterium sp.]
MPNGDATSHLYRPKLVSVLAEGYGPGDLRRDATAGLTVAVLALPLSMAIAVASGVPPERGLYTAIVGGFVVSALGGSRFQIGGPAGAFIVLVSATVAQLGLAGLAVTVALSGLMLTALGLFRLGGLIRHIPHAVTVGFTAGIGVTILASQIKDLAGLTLAGAEPGPVWPKLMAMAGAAPTFNAAALAVGVGVTAVILMIRRYRPAWPGMLVALAAATAIVEWAHLPVETIGSRFGGIPQSLPAPALPAITWPLVLACLPAAVAFTVLGGLESLLSAKVADGLTGRVHRSNMELVAQGLANLASAAFGGIAVTGTIARTAANIRAGAVGPIAGILHALFLLLFMLLAAPLAAHIPLAALAGILVVVAWNMIEAREIAGLLANWRAGVVVLATFGFTVLHDLTAGLLAGCGAALLFWLSSQAARRLRP